MQIFSWLYMVATYTGYPGDSGSMLATNHEGQTTAPVFGSNDVDHLLQVSRWHKDLV